MFAIETKYMGATNYRSSRIKAQAWDAKITMPYNHSLSGSANHALAAALLAERIGAEIVITNVEPANNRAGYVFVAQYNV